VSAAVAVEFLKMSEAANPTKRMTDTFLEVEFTP
jgi:hypothetical protein